MYQQKKINLTLIFSVFLLLVGCAGQEIVEGDVGIVEGKVDPYEGFNRSMFGFNEVLDDYVAEPISDAYLFITPQFVQTGIANFFSNLDDINVVLNDVMQGKLGQGAEDTGRFAINSTIGLLGLFDVATELGLKKNDEDFAQTLGVWGVPQGPYLVIPVLGPSTSRGVPGSVFDTAANQASYVGFPVQMVQMLNARANAEGSLKFIDEAAMDPYIFTRESFLQYRKHLVTDGNSEITDDILDFEDEFYDEEDFSDSSETEVVNDEVVDQDEKGNANKLELSVDSVDNQKHEEHSGSVEDRVDSFEDSARSPEKASDQIK